MSSKDKEAEASEATVTDDPSKEKPTSEMAAALAKLQDKGADISSSSPGSNSGLEKAIAEKTEVAEKAEVAEAGAGADDALSATTVKSSEAKVESVASGSAGTTPIIYVAKHDALGRAYATGKRKNSIVRVWVKPGKGNFRVNGRELEKYFARDVLCMLVKQPFEVVKCENAFDVMCTAKGGGLSGQAGALKHGISRALCNFDPQFRPALKNAGFMTRDARIVERKKYGKPKARRSFQFSKR